MFELIREETFTWTKADGQQFQFRIPPMRAWCEAHGHLESITFPAGFRDVLAVVNDVHPPRAMALPEAALSKPPIVLFDDYGVVVADGSHRLWRQLGERPDVPCFLLPWDFAVEHFLLPAEVIVVGWQPGGAPTYDPEKHRADAMAASQRRKP